MTMADDEARWGGEVDGQYEDCDELGEVMDCDDGQDHIPGQAPEAEKQPSSMQIRLNSLFKKASAVSGLHSTADDDAPQLPCGGFQLGELKGPRYWTAFPSIDVWYKTAERHSDMKTKAATAKNICMLEVRVDGLTPARWKFPQVEPGLLPAKDRPKKGQVPTPTKHPDAVVAKAAREPWFACLRSAGLLSCAGVIESYVEALTTSTDETKNLEALQQAGVDSQAVAPFPTDPDASAYFSESKECTHVIYCPMWP